MSLLSLPPKPEWRCSQLHILKESTDVECETSEVLCQSPRVGSISIIGTRVSREVSDALARRGAVSLPKESNSVRLPPNKVVSIAEPIWRPVRRM
jgi:hypothetical protein